MDLDLYELSFDHIKSLIYKSIFYIIPIASAAYILFKFAYKHLSGNNKGEDLSQKHNIKCIPEEINRTTYRLSRRLDVTKRADIIELLENLPIEYPDYCHINFITESHSFYLINDTELIESIRTDESLSGIFESQLYQPYLILDSNCDLKLKKIEYDKLMKPVLKKCFESVKMDFTESLLPTKFDKFLQQNKELSQRDLFELVFELSTIYINQIFNLTCDSNGLTSGKKLILFNLFEIHQTFSLSLFINSSTDLVDDYTKSYKEFMELVEQEFNTQTDLNDFDINEEDIDKLKFLVIKNIYLDSLKVYSVLTWFLHEMCHDESTTGKSLLEAIIKTKHFHLEDSGYLNEMLLRCYMKILSVDLYYVNAECEIPSKFSFLPKKKLIALNIFNFVNNIETDENLGQSFSLLDDFVQVMCQSLAIFFTKNFDLKQSDQLNFFQSTELYDLPLIRYFDAY